MSRYPNWEIGDLVTADMLNAGSPNVYAKSSSTSRSSATTVSDDPELQGIALDVGTYEIELLMIFNQAASAAAPGIRTQWGFTGTWNAPFRIISGIGNTNTASPEVATVYNGRSFQTSSAATYTSAGSAFATVREVTAQAVVTVAGSLSLQWAQNSSVASNTTVQAGTAFIVRRAG